MKLELFYDIESAYSYLAFMCLDRYRARWSAVDLVLRPAFLGGVFKAVGNVPPITLAARAPYLVRDMGRLGGYFDVPVTIPNDFPGNSLTTMRFLTVVARERPALLRDASRALYLAHWGKGDPVDTPETIARAWPAGADLVGHIGDQATKDALKKSTDEVVERGAFGFPAMFVTDDGGVDEMYFGSDRISLLAHEHKLPWDGPAPK